MFNITVISLSVASFGISAFFALLITKLGFALNLVDDPNERSSHSSSMPRSGGIGIWVCITFAVFFMQRNIPFTLTVFLIGLLGLIEDYLRLSSKLRLLSHLVLSFALVFFTMTTPYSFTSLVLLVFWTIFIAGTANIYNFMDGIDGIAALTGITAFGLTAYYAFFIAEDPVAAAVSLVVTTTCFGFLIFNFPRAKVFMGDVGSMVLGFCFGAVVMHLSRSFLDFVCLCSFLFEEKVPGPRVYVCELFVRHQRFVLSESVGATLEQS